MSNQRVFEKRTEDMTIPELLELYNIVRERRRGHMEAIVQWHGTREKLIGKIERGHRRMRKENQTAAQILTAKAPRRKKEKTTVNKRPGIGKLVNQLLCEVIGTNDEGFPVGHSYNVIVDKVRETFPDSKFDDRHARWYCTKLREKGIQPPVYRERGKWQEK